MPQFLKNKFIRLYFYLALVLIISSAFLFSLPKFIQLTEKNILISSNTTSTNLQNSLTARAKKTVIKLEESQIPPPKISAQGALVLDLTSDKIVFSKNIHPFRWCLADLIYIPHENKVDIIKIKSDQSLETN